MNLRRRIWRNISDFNEPILKTQPNGFNYNTSIIQEIEEEYLKISGDEKLKAYSKGRYQTVHDIESFLLGTMPTNVLDFLEVFHSQLYPDNAYHFCKVINEIFTSEGSMLRIIDGSFVFLDSDFLESEISSKANELLNKGDFEIAFSDFKNARIKLSTGDFDGCIVDANNAIESLIKKITDEDKGRQKDLKKNLIKSGLIPNYFEGFLEHFDSFLQDAFSIANKTSRHGKKEIPKGNNKVDRHVASFLLHLVGTLIVFIVEKYINNLNNE